LGTALHPTNIDYYFVKMVINNRTV